MAEVGEMGECGVLAVAEEGEVAGGGWAGEGPGVSGVLGGSFARLLCVTLNGLCAIVSQLPPQEVGEGREWGRVIIGMPTGQRKEGAIAGDVPSTRRAALRARA